MSTINECKIARECGDMKGTRRKKDSDIILCWLQINKVHAFNATCESICHIKTWVEGEEDMAACGRGNHDTVS